MFERGNGFTDLSETASITAPSQVSMANFASISMPKTRSALAIFCRAPRLGSVKTRLAKARGDKFALGLYRAMLADTFALGRALAPEIETFACFTPGNGFDGADSLAPLWDGPRIAQCQGDLGAKLLGCFADLRARGFEKTAVIGSDSPDLPIHLLREAFSVLNDYEMAIGPSLDGGFYLMSAGVELPAAVFHRVVWSSSSTLENVQSNLQQLSKEAATTVCYSLAPWRDVDDEGDLIELKRRLCEVGTHAPHTRDFLAENF